MSIVKFNGFSPETLEFLKNIQANNNKSWYEANKAFYQQYLLTPFQNLVADLGGFMLSIDPHLEVTPAVSKTISRIYRDTRFSKDKSPYRSNMWITFKRPIKDWQDAPAYYFELTPDSYRYGMGFYAASKQTMDHFRERILEDTPEFLEAISFYTNTSLFSLEGEKYKKTLAPTLPPAIQEWYQRKYFYLTCKKEIDERLFSPSLVHDLILGFDLLAPLYHYLWKLR